MKSLRASTAMTIVAAGIPLALLLPASTAERVWSSLVVLAIAAGIVLFAPRDPRPQGSLADPSRDTGTGRKDDVGDIEALRSIQRRRNAVVWAVAAVVVVALLLVAYGPWAH